MPLGLTSWERKMPEKKPEIKRKGVEVIVDMFSGQPNPTWTLTERQVTALVKLLGKDYRKKSAVKFRKPPGLGYRGFIISNPGGRKGLPRALRVYKGVINIREQGAKKRSEVYSIGDMNRIEAWLMEQAAQKDLDKEIRRMGGPGRIRRL